MSRTTDRHCSWSIAKRKEAYPTCRYPTKTKDMYAPRSHCHTINPQILGLKIHDTLTLLPYAVSVSCTKRRSLQRLCCCTICWCNADDLWWRFAYVTKGPKRGQIGSENGPPLSLPLSALSFFSCLSIKGTLISRAMVSHIRLVKQGSANRCGRLSICFNFYLLLHVLLMYLLSMPNHTALLANLLRRLFFNLWT